MQSVTLFDTTLRDGAQSPDVTFRLEDKLQIMRALDDLGVHYIEGGWVGANPTDSALFEQDNVLAKSRLVSFGMTARVGRSAGNDPTLAPVLGAKADAYCLFGKSWDYHVTKALNSDVDAYLKSIHDSVAEAAKHGEAMFDAEHFFQGFEENPDYALAAVKTAYDAGARWIVLCDTNGIMYPTDVGDVVRHVGKIIPPEQLGIHTHNDRGFADANSWAAMEAGCHQVQGTINGLGERTGNANLINIISQIVLDRKHRFDCGLTEHDLIKLNPLSDLVATLSRRPVPKNAPFISTASAEQKAGAHVSAFLKDERLYQSHNPRLFGLEPTISVSNQSGVSNFIPHLQILGLNTDKDNPALRALVAELKQRQEDGYEYSKCMGSFEVLAFEMYGVMPQYFDLSTYHTSVQRLPSNGTPSARKKFKLAAQATVEMIDSNGDVAIPDVSNGNGPVNALDLAMRRSLNRVYPELNSLQLTNYEQVVINPYHGTDAVMQVKIVSFSEQTGEITTVGVSGNSIDASVNALMDSYLLHLKRMNVAPRPYAKHLIASTGMQPH